MGWKLWLQYSPPATTAKAIGKAWNEWTQERPWRHRCHFHSRAQLIRWLFCWFPSPKSTQRQQQTNIKTHHPSAVPAQHGSRSQLQSTVGMYNDSIQRATSPAASACELGVLPSRLRCLSPVTLRLRPIAAGRAKCCLAGLTGGGCQCRCLKGGHNRHAGFVWCFGERGTARPIYLHVPLSPWAWVVPRIHECLIEFRACGCYLQRSFFSLFSLSPFTDMDIGYSKYANCPRTHSQRYDEGSKSSA